MLGAVRDFERRVTKCTVAVCSRLWTRFRFVLPGRTFSMATPNGAPLASTSKLFDHLQPALPFLPTADPSLIALDAFKLAAAKHVSETLGVDLATAFAGIEDPKKGQDLQLAVARFRLPGKNAAPEAAKKLAETVRSPSVALHCD
jgi:hypothetical protein